MANTLIKIGTVIDVEGSNPYTNETDGLRVKARIAEDKDLPSKKIEWAFPLLPKTLQSIPKIGEAVLIITAEVANSQSQRFYIGPIISQPQYMEFCPGNYNTPATEMATTLLQGKHNEPLGKISNNNSTKGAFPEYKDVAIIGRGREDIRLKHNTFTDKSQIEITAGIREKQPTNTENKDLFGNIVFNNQNPAYIQLNHEKNKGPYITNKSEINIVADTINIMSHKDKSINAYLTDQENLISDDNKENIEKSLHPAVKGDKLLELLKIIIGVVLNHIHPWSGMEQCGDWNGFNEKLENFDVNSILSKNVNISE